MQKTSSALSLTRECVPTKLHSSDSNMQQFVSDLDYAQIIADELWFVHLVQPLKR